MQVAGILSGPEIRKQIELGRITIDPFQPKHVNPASVDLTLGSMVSLYEGTFKEENRNRISVDGRTLRAVSSLPSPNPELVWDTRTNWPTVTRTIDPICGWVLKPGICYLMHTAERIRTDHFVPIIDGKSSLGRSFVLVHYTAGYGDPGFDGQYTLEVTTQIPVRVYAGMRFCQVRFHTLVGDVELYQGHYTNDRAKGAVGTRICESGYDTQPAPVIDDGDLANELLEALEV